MDQRRIAATVAENVTDALAASGETVDSLAAATDTTTPQMEAQLSGAADFTFAGLVAAGGFFRVRPDSFFEGAQA